MYLKNRKLNRTGAISVVTVTNDLIYATTGSWTVNHYKTQSRKMSKGCANLKHGPQSNYSKTTCLRPTTTAHDDDHDVRITFSVRRKTRNSGSLILYTTY